MKKSRRGLNEIDELIARSSIGAARADVKRRGIDAHLIDLEREMRPRQRPAKPAATSPVDAAFMRGFGVALAAIWQLHHDGQMVRHLISANGFSLTSFRDVGMLDADYEAICRAVRP